MSAAADRMEHLAHPLRRRLTRVSVIVWAVAPFWVLLLKLTPNDSGILAVMMILHGTGHATRRFASSEATEWALARGIWTRRDLARWTVAELAWRAFNCALAAFVVTRFIPINDASIFSSLTIPWVLATMSLALVIGSFLIHAQGSTHLPRWVAAVRSTHGRPTWRACGDFLLLGLLGAALAAPGALVAYALRSFWPVAIYAALLTIPLYFLIAEIEPIALNPHGEPRGERRGVPSSHKFAPLTALVWRALDWRVKLLVGLEIASCVALSTVGKYPDAPDESPFAFIMIFWAFLGISMTLQFALALGAFHWKSHGPTTEYLASLGVECSMLRRIELVAGPTLSLLVIGMWATVLTTSAVETLLFAVASVVLLASNHRRLGPVRVHRMLFPLVLSCLVVPLIVWWFTRDRVFGSELYARCVQSIAEFAPMALLAFAAWQWIVAWLETRHPQRLRERELSLGT